MAASGTLLACTVVDDWPDAAESVCELLAGFVGAMEVWLAGDGWPGSMSDSITVTELDVMLIVLVATADHELGAAVVVESVEAVGIVGVAMTACGVRATGGSYLCIISNASRDITFDLSSQSLQTQSTTLPSRIQVPHL